MKQTACARANKHSIYLLFLAANRFYLAFSGKIVIGYLLSVNRAEESAFDQAIVDNLFKMFAKIGNLSREKNEKASDRRIE